MNSIPVIIVLMCLGILSGWSNENVSVSLILLAAGYMRLYREKYSMIPRFAKTSIVSLVIGSLILWLAPGNFVRFASEHHSRSIIHMIGNVFHNIGALFDFESTLLLIISFVLLMFFCKNDEKESGSPLYGGWYHVCCFNECCRLHFWPCFLRVCRPHGDCRRPVV